MLRSEEMAERVGLPVIISEEGVKECKLDCLGKLPSRGRARSEALSQVEERDRGRLGW